MENATSDAISSEPTPAPAMQKISSNPACRPKMVALALRTPYDSPCDIDSTAPEPGETAMMQAATTKVIHVVKLMLALHAKKLWPASHDVRQTHCNGPPRGRPGKSLRRRRSGWSKMAHHPPPAPPCTPTATAHRPPRS